MASLRTIPGILKGCSSDTRELTFQISASTSNTASQVLGSLGCDALIEDVFFSGVARPSTTRNLRLFRMRATDDATSGSVPPLASVDASQFITDDYATGAGTGLQIGNGTGTGAASSTPRTKSTMRATLTTASSGSNSGLAPLNNVLYATDIICLSASGALTGTVGATVTIRFREIQASALGNDPNYVAG